MYNDLNKLKEKLIKSDLDKVAFERTLDVFISGKPTKAKVKTFTENESKDFTEMFNKLSKNMNEETERLSDLLNENNDTLSTLYDIKNAYESGQLSPEQEEEYNKYLNKLLKSDQDYKDFNELEKAKLATAGYEEPLSLHEQNDLHNALSAETELTKEEMERQLKIEADKTFFEKREFEAESKLLKKESKKRDKQEKRESKYKEVILPKSNLFVVVAYIIMALALCMSLYSIFFGDQIMSLFNKINPYNYASINAILPDLIMFAMTTLEYGLHFIVIGVIVSLLITLNKTKKLNKPNKQLFDISKYSLLSLLLIIPLLTILFTNFNSYPELIFMAIIYIFGSAFIFSALTALFKNGILLLLFSLPLPAYMFAMTLIPVLALVILFILAMTNTNTVTIKVQK